MIRGERGMSEAIITALIGIIPTVFVAVIGIVTNNRVIAVKIDALEKKVEKHNEVVMRTYQLESVTDTMWKRHDELKERVEKLEDIERRG